MTKILGAGVVSDDSSYYLSDLEFDCFFRETRIDALADKSLSFGQKMMKFVTLGRRGFWPKPTLH